MRTVLVLLLALVLILALVSIVRALGGEAGAGSAAPVSPSALPSEGASAEGEGAAQAPSSPTPESEGHPGADASGGEEIVRTGTVGDGSWTLAAPAAAPSAADGTVHRYAVRVEGGTDIDAEEAAATIAEVLADPRGWQDLQDVTFVQVATLEEADFTISLASPPTVDELCLPARTDGLWSCRIGPDVALNSDRWLHATPTYQDLVAYRAYMINHEVGHFLGHDHARCSGDGARAPVMLQQSMDLQGCVPNAWPAEEPGR